MDDDIDIYEDLPSFGAEFSENCIRKNEGNVLAEQLQLKKQIAELTEKVENFQKINSNLEINLFSLLRTAKAEITRKDKMIEDLRKKLDDIMFKRGMHYKNSNYVFHKPVPQEAWESTQLESPSSYFVVNENNADTSTAESSFNPTKDQRHQSALVPTTVFGKRLLERIMDEQKLGKKVGSCSKFNGSSNNNNENLEGYIVESDKENGSLNDTNLFNTKEIECSMIVQYKGNEHVKNLSVGKSKILMKDIEFYGEEETVSRQERKPVLGANHTGKRASEDVNRQMSVKRIKSTDSMGKEIDCKITMESKEKCALPRYSDLESCVHFKEKRYLLKNSDIGYTRNSSVKIKKHDAGDVAKKQEVEKNSKIRMDLSRNTRDANERSTKRHNKSENSTLTLDERDIFKKDDHRLPSRSEHRRNKQRGYYRSDDRRSRVKSVSCSKKYEESNREEKYSRNQYSKHTDYGEKFEKRYNFRSSSVDKSKFCKKDFCSFRGDSKINGHYDDYEVQKVGSKNVDRRFKREMKRDKYDTEYDSYCKFEKATQNNFIEHQKYFKISKRNSARDNEVSGAVSENELGIHDELEMYAKEELQNAPIDLEDGEILNTPNSSHTNAQNGCKGSRGKSDFVSTLNDVSVKVIKCSSLRCEVGDRSRISCNTVPSAMLDPNTSVSSIQNDRNSFENMGNMENVENVENIEKFIRDYASTYYKTCEETASTSDKICTLDDIPVPLNRSSMETKNEENANVLKNIPSSEDKSKDNSVPILDVNEIVPVPFNDHHKTEKKLSIADEKSTNTSVPCMSENNCPVKMTKDNPFPNSETEMTWDHANSTTDDRLLENTHSPIVRTSSKEKDEKKNNGTVDIYDTAAKDRTNDNNHCNSSKVNLNDLGNSTMAKTVHQDFANTVMEMEKEKECVKCVGKREEARLEELKKPLQNLNNDMNAKVTSMNVQGKIIVFARRKKPVCLANSNANMTVLINKKYDTNLHSTNNIMKCNSVLKNATTNSCDTTISTTHMNNTS